MASKIQDTGNIIIPTSTIDEVTQGRKVTFIKMDIEGAERYALKGAEQTIRKYHPTLAICAYHKCDDCFVLPEIIKNFYDGYRFYFRLNNPSVKFFGNMYNIHMKTIEQINKLTDEKFRRVFGITRDTFFFNSRKT